MLMDLFLQLRGTIYDRGDKLHSNERQIPLYFKLQIPPLTAPHVYGFGVWKVKVRVLGWEDWVGEHRPTAQGDLGRGPLWTSCFTCSHMSPPFRGVLMASIYGRGNLGRRKFKDLPHTLQNFRVCDI